MTTELKAGRYSVEFDAFDRLDATLKEFGYFLEHSSNDLHRINDTKNAYPWASMYLELSVNNGYLLTVLHTRSVNDVTNKHGSNLAESLYSRRIATYIGSL